MSKQNKPLQKIRILYLISALKKCGPINVLYNLIKGLNPKKNDIFIVSLSEGETGSIVDQFEALDIDIISLNESRIKGFFVNQRIIQKILNDKQIDIVHSHGFRADKINSQLKNVLTINTIHNFPSEDYIHRYGKIIGSWMSIEHKNKIKDIQFPVACSKTLMQKFNDVYDINTEFIQNGIDIKKFSPLTENKNKLRKSLNLPIDPLIFIVSGALSQLKNPKVLIETFQLQKNENHVLLFIGNGELFGALSKTYESTNICFAGRVDKVNEYLQASDFYISASLTEGFPNSVLEAISVGLPMILSNIPAHVEIIGDNYPYLFNPKSSEDLTKKLKLIIQKENKLYSQMHSLKIKNDFNAQLMSNKYEQLYISSAKRAKK